MREEMVSVEAIYKLYIGGEIKEEFEIYSDFSNFGWPKLMYL